MSLLREADSVSIHGGSTLDHDHSESRMIPFHIQTVITLEETPGEVATDALCCC